MPTSSIPRSTTRLALLLALAWALLCGPLPATAHEDKAYWHNDGAASHNPQWMLTISPDKTLADLSLPGTHDSGTFRGRGGPNARTQTMTIREQLDSGIRWLDIRLKYYDASALRNCNENHVSANCQLLVFHGISNQGVEFGSDVLQPVVSFLQDNPSELVIMRIAKEVADCDCNPARPLNELFRKPAVINGVTMGQSYADWLLPRACPDPEQLVLGPVRPLNTTPDATSCHPRGKLLIIDQYLGGLLTDKHQYRQQIGETDSENIPYVQPGYGALNTIGQFYDNLWLPVKAHLTFANATRSPAGRLFNTGLSANGPSFPFFFASGHASEATDAPRLSTGLVQGISADSSTWPDFPRTACVGSLCTISYEGMNTLVADYLMFPQFHLAGSRVGIVNADFPGERFITSVASVNAGVSFNRPSFAYALTTANGKPYRPGSWTNDTVTVRPVCSFPCIGDRTAITEDLPDGFTYTFTGAGRTLQVAASPVRIDLVRPTLTAAATTSPAGNGWYTGNVVVRFSCADTGGSNVAECPPDQVLSQERTVSSTVQYALDGAGNKSNPSNTVAVKIDKTPPSIAYRGNLGSYAPGQTVEIQCQAVDRESGIASTTCADIRGPASSFGAGTHRFSATATDVAGRTSTAITSFTVVTLPGDVTVDGIVDCRDLSTVKAAYGKRVGAAGFDARADTNGDGVVDIRDLSFVAQKLPVGTTCP